MHSVVVTIIAALIVAFIVIALSYLYNKDKKRIRNVAAALGVDTRFSFLRGWVAESSERHSRIWITRWDDPSCDGPALLIYADYDKPLSFPVTIVNKKSGLLGLPFERPFSRKKGLKEIDADGALNGVHVYCRTHEKNICRIFLTHSACSLTNLAGIYEKEKAIFNAGQARIRISVDLDTSPSTVKNLYDAARSLAEVITSGDPRRT